MVKIPYSNQIIPDNFLPTAHPQHLGPIGFQLLRPHAADALQVRERCRAALGNRCQRRAVEDHIGGQAVSAGDLCRRIPKRR